MDSTLLERQLDFVLRGTQFENWVGPKIEGKARDNYVVDDRRIMIATDRVSAFDQHLGYIPFKGQIVTEMSVFWFQQTKDIVANHLLDMPHPNVLIVKECTPLPVEMVVRAYLTGVTPTSIWYQYQRGVRSFCGHSLPDGLKKNHRLPEPIITPSTKAPKGARDESISAQDVLKRSLVDERRMAEMSEAALAVFHRGSEIASKRGFILVDTKYEFGVDAAGKLHLIDEVHTPDSSRFWPAETYASLYQSGSEQPEYDKEYIRLWLASLGFDGGGPVPHIPKDIFVGAAGRYIEAFEAITQQQASLPIGDQTPQIEAALRRVMP